MFPGISGCFFNCCTLLKVYRLSNINVLSELQCILKSIKSYMYLVHAINNKITDFINVTVLYFCDYRIGVRNRVVVQFAGSVRKSLRVEELEVVSVQELDVHSFSHMGDTMLNTWAALINHSVSLAAEPFSTGKFDCSY